MPDSSESPYLWGRVRKLLPLERDGSQCSLAAACTLELHLRSANYYSTVFINYYKCARKFNVMTVANIMTSLHSSCTSTYMASYETLSHCVRGSTRLGPACDKMEWIYVSTKAICRGSVELASLMKKERRKSKFYHCLVQDVDDHFRRYLHAYR